jgi:hypothetical protein
MVLEDVDGTEETLQEAAIADTARAPTNMTNMTNQSIQTPGPTGSKPSESSFLSLNHQPNDTRSEGDPSMSVHCLTLLEGVVFMWTTANIAPITVTTTAEAPTEVPAEAVEDRQTLPRASASSALQISMRIDSNPSVSQGKVYPSIIIVVRIAIACIIEATGPNKLFINAHVHVHDVDVVACILSCQSS